MPPHPLILPREPFYLLATQTPSQSHIQLSRELVEEFRQKLYIEEKDGSGGQLGSDDVEEDLGTDDAWVVGRFLVRFFGFWNRGGGVGARGGFEGVEAEVEESGAIGEEECFLAFCDMLAIW